ncbi:hypothetical protein HaLaN_10757 [Haematococcus lacustris]|uniref:Uncharacterized protein n=1 Tax=Haematococcus lacustris TaxID=44745 RepID=A0A699Z5P6_HAELA|nr:hypothetical protein HaLaN_10757 [Haematococcus lacustris]
MLVLLTRGTSNSHTCQPGGDSCSADAGEAGGSLAALAGSEPPAAGARRAPSGLPLRKSQSAVELGSWRSFNAGEEYWDHALGAEGIQVPSCLPTAGPAAAQGLCEQPAPPQQAS